MKIKVKAAPHKKETIEINTDFIQLQAFLKFIGVAETGGHAKELIQNNMVKVNGEVCLARGKKLRHGDIVTAFGTDYTVIQNKTDENS